MPNGGGKGLGNVETAGWYRVSFWGGEVLELEHAVVWTMNILKAIELHTLNG